MNNPLKYKERLFANHPELLGADYRSHGNYLCDSGDYQGAIDYINKALEIHTGVKDIKETSLDITALGVVHWELGDLHQARIYFEKALELDRNIYGFSHSLATRNMNNAILIDAETKDREKDLYKPF